MASGSLASQLAEDPLPPLSKHWDCRHYVGAGDQNFGSYICAALNHITSLSVLTSENQTTPYLLHRAPRLSIAAFPGKEPLGSLCFYPASLRAIMPAEVINMVAQTYQKGAEHCAIVQVSNQHTNSALITSYLLNLPVKCAPLPSSSSSMVPNAPTERVRTRR